MAEIILLPVPDIMVQGVYERLLAKVGNERYNKTVRFRFRKDAYRSLLGDLLVRMTVSRHLGVRNSDIRFGTNQYGKPHLIGMPDFSFNLAHSGEWLALIWSRKNQALGVDVEAVKPIDFGIAERFFTAEEQAYIMSKDGSERLDAFFTLWTLKESYIKARGKGLSIPLDSFTLLHRAGNLWYTPEDKSVSFIGRKWGGEYCVAACTELEPPPDYIEKMQLEALYLFYGE